MKIFASTLLALCACLLASSPQLTAGQADGTYKILRITSSFEQNGEPYKIPQKDIKEALFGSEGIVVVDNKLPVYQPAWFQDIKDPAVREIIKSVEITGPRKVRLTRSEDGLFRGRTDNPLIAKFSFNLAGARFPISMRVHSRAKLDGNKLIVIMPIRAAARDGDPEIEDIVVTGTVRIVAERP